MQIQMQSNPFCFDHIRNHDLLLECAWDLNINKGRESVMDSDLFQKLSYTNYHSQKELSRSCHLIFLVTQRQSFLNFAAFLTHNLKTFLLFFFQRTFFLQVIKLFSYSVMELIFILYLIWNILCSRSSVTKDKQARYSPCPQGGYTSEKNNKMGNFNPESCWPCVSCSYRCCNK